MLDRREWIGKSTLLKTLTGFLPKLKGSLLLDNRDIESFSQRELARQVSIVLTQKPDVQNLTIEEIIGLGRSPYTGFFGHCVLKTVRLLMTQSLRWGLKSSEGE